jgi:hypothetical protein
MHIMTSYTIILPAFLASALINGDMSGLNDEDLVWVERVVAYASPGRIVSCDEDTWFSRSNDLPGYTLACDVARYTVLE